MVSLAIYIISFVIVIGIVSTITVFFNNNIEEVNLASGASSEYNKFNMYMLDQTKGGYHIEKCSEQYVTFSNGTKTNTFVLLGNMLYFNEIKLCENINEFKVSRGTAPNGKEVLNTCIDINGIVYTTNYVIE